MENFSRYNVQVKKITIENELQYKNTVVLHYEIEYPQFLSRIFEASLNKINRHYKMKALAIQRNFNTRLYRSAVQNYEYATANGFPFHPYQAVVKYEVTYNKDCTISLYFDQYEYTGGAHGNTVRSSDTWNLQNGRRIMLGQLFRYPFHYKPYIIKTIINQIEKQIESGDNPYFEEYKKNVATYFNPSSFYLTNKGIVIYFQQYEIAPYASGIREFTIPYSDENVERPKCKV